MSVIDFFQTIHCAFLSLITQAGDYIISLPFLLFLFAIAYYFCNKNISLKVFLGFYMCYFVCAVLLKNVFNIPRPFVTEPDLSAIKNLSSYSMPSFALTAIGGLLAWAIYSTCKKTNRLANGKKSVIWQFLLPIILLLFFAFVKLYTAQNYLLDLIVGFVLGALLFYLAFKLFDKKCIIVLPFLALIPIAVLLINYSSLSQFSQDQTLFKYCGFFIAASIGIFLEGKLVKHQHKNNLFTVLLKLFTTIICLWVPITLFEMLSTSNIVAVLEYMVVGLVATIALPALFNLYNKKCYVFAKNVDSSSVYFSSISLSKKQTYGLAKRLDKYISSGDTIVLCGDLGAGKSELVRGYLMYKGVKNKITSPTFTLVNEHFGKDNHFYHFDLYRIEQEDEVKNLDFEEIIDDAYAIKFVEWAEKAPNYLPKTYKKITITKLGKTTRNIVMEQINGEEK